MVKITLEFPSIDVAIVALGKLVGTPVKATQPVAASVAAGQGATAPAAPTTTRKGRNDKGVPRKPKAEPAGAGATVTTTASAAAPQAAPAGEASVSTLTAADTEKALEAVFNGKGLPTAQALLQRFGIARLRDLKPEQYVDFVAAAKEVVEGKPV